MWTDCVSAEEGQKVQVRNDQADDLRDEQGRRGKVLSQVVSVIREVMVPLDRAC